MKFFGVLFLVIGLISSQASAAPIGGDLSAENGSITHLNKVVDGKNITHTTITTNKNWQKINWTDFSSKSGEIIKFKQPNSKAVVFNKVTGNIPSTLAGSLTANGRVVIMNGAGVTFAAGSKVNVGSLYATTAKTVVGNEFYGVLKGATKPIVNDGTIKAVDGGVVKFNATQITNNGTIIADRGLIDFIGFQNSRSQFVSEADSKAGNLNNILDKPMFAEDHTGANPTSDAIVITNNGKLYARSGEVNMYTDYNKIDAANVINLNGVVDATRLVGSKIDFETSYISAGARDTYVGGTLIANAQEGLGGTIGISAGRHLHIKDTARLYANGGKTAGTLNTTGGGRIGLEVVGNPNGSLKVDGRIYAGEGVNNPSKYKGGIVTIASSPSGTDYTDITIGSTAIISTKPAYAEGGSGGDITVTGNKITSAGTYIADGVGTGNGGNLEFNSAYSTGKVDIANSRIYSRGGEVSGNGGSVKINVVQAPGSTQSPVILNKDRIYLGARSAYPSQRGYAQVAKCYYWCDYETIVTNK